MLLGLAWYIRLENHLESIVGNLMYNVSQSVDQSKDSHPHNDVKRNLL